MNPQDDFSLTNGGDCFSHWHSEDRVPTQSTLHGLQGVKSEVNTGTDLEVDNSTDILYVDTSSNDVVITLPLARNGREITVIKISQLNTLIITATSPDSIQGLSSIAFTTQWTARTLKADSTGWSILNGLVWDKVPYGAFSSVNTQSVATINTPTLVVLDSVDFAHKMTRVLGDGVHVQQAGIYNIQFSVQLTNSDNQIHDAAFWLKKNGTDLTMSNSVISITGTHGGQSGYHVAAANFYVQLNVDDYIEMWWSTNALQVTLQTLPAITTPFIAPGAPSVVVTVSYVSSEA